MSKHKNQKSQAQVEAQNPTPEELEEAMDDGEDIEQGSEEMTEEGTEEAAAGTTEKVKELTPEQKQQRIQSLCIQLQAAKKGKEIKAQKKIRRNLRKLGFYISKEKETALDAVLGASE